MLNISWNSDKEWFQEYVKKISGFIWILTKYQSVEVLLTRENVYKYIWILYDIHVSN